MRKRPFTVLSFMFIVLGFFLSYNLRLFERYTIFTLISIYDIEREDNKRKRTWGFILTLFGQWL